MAKITSGKRDTDHGYSTNVALTTKNGMKKKSSPFEQINDWLKLLFVFLVAVLFICRCCCDRDKSPPCCVTNNTTNIHDRTRAYLPLLMLIAADTDTDTDMDSDTGTATATTTVTDYHSILSIMMMIKRTVTVQ